MDANYIYVTTGQGARGSGSLMSAAVSVHGNRKVSYRKDMAIRKWENLQILYRLTDIYGTQINRR